MTTSDHDRLKRFAELVSAYGARSDAWPESARGWARALTDASPEARRLLADAAEVDGWLDSLTVPPVPAGLDERILAGVPGSVRPPASRSGPSWMPGRLWARLTAGMPVLPARPACAVVAAAIAGLLLGWGGVFSTAVPDGEEEEIVAMAFVGGGLERYELGEWQ